MKVTTDTADGINRSTANYVAGIMGKVAFTLPGIH
jgi:hypothetical protein